MRCFISGLLRCYSLKSLRLSKSDLSWIASSLTFPRSPAMMPVYTPTTSSDPDRDTHKLKLVYFSNEFPRDDLQGVFRRLHNHSKDSAHPILAEFISRATWAIKDEVRQLQTEIKHLIPPFETLFSWAESTELREGLICGAVDGVLLLVVQLATYIGWVGLQLDMEVADIVLDIQRAVPKPWPTLQTQALLALDLVCWHRLPSRCLPRWQTCPRPVQMQCVWLSAWESMSRVSLQTWKPVSRRRVRIPGRMWSIMSTLTPFKRN